MNKEFNSFFKTNYENFINESKFIEISKKYFDFINEDEEENYKFKVIASDETLDRDGEIIKINGWDFENYLKNPVILINHDWEVENIVGKAEKLYIENGKLIIEGIFAKGTSNSYLTRTLYNQGMLKAVSVGFSIKERDLKNPSIITKAELLELSFVVVNSNPSALSLDGKNLENNEENKQIEENEKKSDEKLDFEKLNSIIKVLEEKVDFLFKDYLEKEIKSYFKN